MTEVALDLAGGGVLVDFLFLGVTSIDSSVGLVVSCTGERTEELRTEGALSND